ncbi:MAG: NADH-ubiquinone oxidoreductase-F iron-sulfur binding region domain-containing protein [Dehalococcoidia bacterium]
MATYEEMRADAASAWAAVEKPARPLFIVSINTSSIARGARKTMEALRSLGAAQGFDVMQTGDTGMAFAEPVVKVVLPDAPAVVYGNVTDDKAEAFVAQALRGIAKDYAIGIVDGPATDGVPALDDTDWMKIQVRWMMRNCGEIDPDSIDHYIARGGYGTFVQSAQMDRDELISVVTGSTLKGHSGSFFSTGTKWKFLKDAKAEPKFLVCNADEGDPGAWVNRVLMESDPHVVLEGMLIAAYASGATYGWIYLRDEYPLANERMNRAIEECRARGIFGPDALGMGVNFDCEVVRGAGAYVCGDETGLISSVNDDRGMPRIKPPFPAQQGVLEKPTNVNNVETYAAAATLLRLGAETYSSTGTEANRGTKLFTVSGAVNRTGCLEVPFGTTVDELLAAIGGIANNGQFKALQQGGPLSGLLPGDVAGPLALEPEPFRPLGAGMGGGGLIFVDERACVVDMNVMFSWFLEDESCGRCTTCRGGNQRMLEIFNRTARGEAEESDVPRLESLGDSFQYSNCFHGSLSPVIMRNTMTHFRDEYDAHAIEHRCPAKVCPDLIRYVVVNQSPAVQEAAKICPTDAIVEQQGAWVIDDAKCIRCNACKDIAPDDIKIEDRYKDMLPLRVVTRANVAPDQVPIQARP